MKKIAKNIICSLTMIVLLMSSAIVSKGSDDLPCADDDTECMVNEYQNALTQLSRYISVTRQAFQPVLAYNSNLHGVDWKFDENGYAVFKSLYPRLVNLLEKDLAERYGFVMPALNSKIPPVAWVFGVIGIISLSINLGNWWDDSMNQPRIDAMTEDLEARDWNHVDAEREANYQWMFVIKPRRALIQLNLPATLGNIKRLVKILSSGRHYNLWAHIHQSEVRDEMERQAAGRRGPDNGRSYADWAARRGGNGNSDGCTAWLYFPGGSSESTDEFGNLVVTVTAPGWRCIQN